VTTLAAACLTVLVLAGAGAAPVVLAVGVRWQSLLLAPLGGAVMAAVAGLFVVAFAGSTIDWFIGLSIAGLGLGAAGMLVRGRVDRPRDDRTGSGGRPASRVIGWSMVAVAVTWSLLPLRVPSVGLDARAIWLLRSAWFASGHQVTLAALRNPQLLVAHASYPPLISATTAVAWQVTGVHTYRLGVVITALLNGCALAVVAGVLIESGALAADRATRSGMKGRDNRVASHLRSSLSAPPIVGGVVAALFVLVVFGVFGPFATNGYADPLWSVAAAGAIGYGLLLPVTRSNRAVAGVLLGVAGLTKDEGIATAMALIVLIVARSVMWGWSIDSRSVAGAGRPVTRMRSALVPVAVGCTGILALAIWPALMRFIGAARDVSTSGARQGTMITRLHLTVNAMWPYLHVLLLAVPISLVGALLLRAERRGLGIGADAWAWAGLVSGLLVVGWAYVTGPGNAPFWLATSVHRTTIYPAIVAWLIVAEWAVIATCSSWSRVRGLPDDPPDSVTAAGVHSNARHGDLVQGTTTDGIAQDGVGVNQIT
jgi:hypothetical protein